jgi:hypothetical protein
MTRIKVRFKSPPQGQNRRLIWDTFFSTKAEAGVSVKYPISELLDLDHRGLKGVCFRCDVARS